MVPALRAALAVTAALVAVLAVGSPASAGVTVTPSEAVQGAAARLTFRVPDGPGAVYTTQVEVQLPPEAPVAEVYPMSVADWAPRMTSRTLDRPIEGIHGSGATTVTSSVTWIRVTGAPRTAGGVSELSLSLGPLPRTDSLPFTVVQTLSDGSVRRWAGSPAANGQAPSGPGPALSLRPATAEGEAATDAPVDQEATPAADEGGPLRYLVAGLLGALLVGLIALAWFFAGRWLTPADPTDGAPAEERETSPEGSAETSGERSL